VEKNEENIIIQKAKAGNKRAFEQIVLEFEKSVYKFCFRFFGNEEDAMDVTQEVFIKVYRALPNFEGRSSLKTWLYRIASNTCLTLASKKKKEKESFLKSIVKWWTEDKSETPETLSIEQENREQIKRIVNQKISKLSENYRIPLILKDIEGMPIDRIAEVLDIPSGTVKSRINRGRKQLQESLQAFYYGREE
jgi:RNA polymerase sigma-70 factor (ECF subfamily)